MDQASLRSILTLNTGSSSLKAALYPLDEAGAPEIEARAERIGSDGSRMRITDSQGAVRFEQHEALPSHDAALNALLTWLDENRPVQQFVAVGHRVVHGGSGYGEPQPITPQLVDSLRQLTPVDPDHLPQAIGAIDAVGRVLPGVQQVACFDTAFHRRMPRVAQVYALPRRFTDAGVVRYGFHGLSYEYIMQELAVRDAAAASGRVIIAHLGNGASMAAVRNGAGVDTTMGFSPTGGLMMGTRSGDLDPGVILYLLQAESLSGTALNELLNKESGLLGVSGASSDMRELLEQEAEDPHAAEAIDLFCYQARKHLGALMAVLGGLDTLVFTAGIGEAAAPVRWRICAGLKMLGIQLDARRNETHAPVISRAGSSVTVRVMRTNEELMIARHVRRLIAREGANLVPV
ncbi:MAG: acetate/propionate family kinase [Chloroflexota bacterium]|nr:acetate/propionate family kinase [Chloroflexota bacterium]